MRVIDVISWFSCSETLIYIIKFQFQPNLRWSNFWLYYCEIQTSNGFSALVFWDMKILKPVLCLFMNLEAMLEPAESSEKVTKIQPPYHTCAKNTQCGNFIIFLSLRFFVKSILGSVKVLKSAIFTHLEALNFDFYDFLHFLKADIYQ